MHAAVILISCPVRRPSSHTVSADDLLYSLINEYYNVMKNTSGDGKGGGGREEFQIGKNVVITSPVPGHQANSYVTPIAGSKESH